MFTKAIVVFGLLAVFSVQGLNANEVHDVQTRATLDELIKQVKEVIENLNKILNGTLADALKMLSNIVATLAEIKQKFLDQGIAGITGSIGNVLEYIKNVTAEAVELGVDISKCIVGAGPQLDELQDGLVGNLTDCITDTVSSVLTMVNDDIKVLHEITSNVTGLPLKLTKCLITLRPITCVTNLLKDAVALLKNLPGQIAAIVENATELVNKLPSDLLGCVTNIVDSSVTQTNAMIASIKECVSEIMAEATTTEAQTTETTTTEATTTEATTTEVPTTEAATAPPARFFGF